MESSGEADSRFAALKNDNDYIADNLNSIHPVLRECFSSAADETIVLRGLEIAFGPCVSSFALEELDDECLRFACPAAKRLYVQALAKIERCGKSNELIGSVADVIVNSLHLCRDVMSQLIGAFGYISDASTVKISRVTSLLTCSSEILFESYRHCSKREECYGVYFNSFAETLMAFFKKAQDLQNSLLHLLSRTESCCEQSEIDVLDRTLTFVYKSGLALFGLNVKTMSDLWKGYACAITKHLHCLKNHHDISVPVKSLAENVSADLESFIADDNSDSQKLVRTVKVSVFILKLIIKFVEHFNGYLGDCQSSLVNLIVTLSRFGNPETKTLVESTDVDANQAKQLKIAVDPLLNHLIGDAAFVEEFRKACQGLMAGSGKRYEFLILSCTIMKKLTVCDSKTRKLWFDSDDNILSWTFRLVTLCNYELCCDIKLPGVQIPGKCQRLIDCYEYLLTAISPFLVMSTSKEFNLAEKLLVKYLLQSNPWCSLLSSDILCVLARFADSELCYNQLSHLCRIFLELETWPEVPQKIFLKSLIKRLFPLLTHKHRDLLRRTFPPEEHVILWHALGTRQLSVGVESSINSTVKCIEKFLSDGAFRQSDFAEMEAGLTSSDLRLRCESKELRSCVAALWKFDADSLTSNPLSKRYITCLCSATAGLLRSMTPQHIYLVLRQMKATTPKLGTVPRLCFVDNLEAFAEVVVPAGHLQAATFKSISSLFHGFLTSDNAFVRARATEAFSTFARATRHADVVTASIGDNAFLQSTLANYVRGQHSSSERQWNHRDYLRKIEGAAYEHSCAGVAVDEFSNSREIHEPSAKKVKLSEGDDEDDVDVDVDEAISAMRRDVARLRGVRAANLSVARRKDLEFVRDALHGILKRGSN